MQWIRAFEQKYKEGVRAFLFTGAVSDGFPLFERTEETDPVDRLDTWHKALSRRLHMQTEDLIWFFDPALGFRFPLQSDAKKSSMEQRFRALVTGDQTPATNDPIAQAAHGMQQSLPLPTDPLEALGLMYTVFDHAIEAQSDDKRKTKMGRCIAILPDFDAVCSGQLGGADRQTERIALLVMRLAESDRFARAGHLLLLSARTMSALPERLRRPESPIVPIIIMPPDETERSRFISSMTDDTESKKAELEHLESELETMRTQERAHLDDKIAQCDAKIAECDEHARIVCQKDDEIKRLLQSLEEERDRLHNHLASGASAREQEITSLRTTIEQTERRLRDDPELQPRPMNAARWKTLKVGDLISVRSQVNQKIETMRVLKDSDEDGDVYLTEKNKDTVNLSSEKTPVLFRWQDGHIECRARKGGQIQLLELSEWVDILLQRGERSRLEQTFVQAKKRLEALQQSGNTIAQTIQTSIDAFSRQIEERSKVICEGVYAHKAGQEKAKHDFKAGKKQPYTPEIKRLEKEVRALRTMIQSVHERKAFKTPSVGANTLTRLTSNLGYRDLVTLFREAQANEQDLSAVEVTTRRIALLTKTYGDLLEIERPPYGFDGVAGLDGVKEYFVRVRDAMLAGDTRRVPMGCLLMGPPGTGKSALATALAHEAGVLLVKIRPIRSKWVGESEQKMEQLFQALRSLAPVVVFRDEVDQEDNGRDGYQGDSGVSNRIRQGWMQFLSDPTIRGRIFVVSATNRPDLLDDALKRAGRTDDRIPILMPDMETRKRLFPVMIKRYGFTSMLTDFTAFAEKTDGFTGADIEVMVRRADQFGNGTIDENSLTVAIEDYIPSASEAGIARMTLLAIKNCSSRQFLPENIQEEIERAVRMLQGLPANSPPIPEINPALFSRTIEEA